MFEKKGIREELNSIDLSLEKNDNWENYSETNNILKKKKIIYKTSWIYLKKIVEATMMFLNL